MKEGQNFKVRRGQDLTLRFAVAGAAGASQAQWFLAASAETAAGARDLALASGGGGAVSIADAGPDAVIDVALTAALTEPLVVGRRFHQLWIVDGTGKNVPVAEGAATVADSLRN